MYHASLLLREDYDTILRNVWFLGYFVVRVKGHNWIPVLKAAASETAVALAAIAAVMVVTVAVVVEAARVIVKTVLLNTL